VNLVVVPQGVTEVVHNVGAKDGVEPFRADPVSENPPSDGDEPHDDEGHGDDVVDEVTAELAAAARHVMATLPTTTDAAGALVHGDPQQEEEADTQAAGYEEPGQVGFRWTIWVWLSIWIGLQSPDDRHAAEYGEAEDVEDAHPPHLPLLPVSQEAATSLTAPVEAAALLHVLVHGESHEITADTSLHVV